MKAKDCKITVGGIEVEGMSSWSFDSFESDEERDKFMEEIEGMYALRIKQEKQNE